MAPPKQPKRCAVHVVPQALVRPAPQSELLFPGYARLGRIQCQAVVSGAPGFLGFGNHAGDRINPYVATDNLVNSNGTSVFGGF